MVSTSTSSGLPLSFREEAVLWDQNGSQRGEVVFFFFSVSGKQLLYPNELHHHESESVSESERCSVMSETL